MQNILGNVTITKSRITLEDASQLIWVPGSHSWEKHKCLLNLLVLKHQMQAPNHMLQEKDWKLAWINEIFKDGKLPASYTEDSFDLFHHKQLPLKMMSPWNIFYNRIEN